MKKTLKHKKHPPKGSVKERIIDTAIRLLSEKGVSETAMLDIARASFTDHQLVYYYFPSITRLHYEVVMRIMNELKGAMLEGIIEHGGNARHDMEKYITSTFEWARNNPGRMSLWIFFYYKASTGGEFKTLNDAFRRTGRERIGALVAKGVGDGVYKRLNADAIRAVSTQIQGLITGNAIMAATESGIDHMDFAAKTYKTVMGMLI
ncbi:MAG: hypothetical protein A2583_12405 [Bdellovibrionales bacterium RIFOXYD1_FULL_53_11]|nr:MAG: hypothetical protein A2583_12405 [Bdellovibrionales bacterium RIFOXYD1_FULL_53_11]